MAPALLAVVLASAVAAPAPPEVEIKPPQGPPPTQVLASITKDGEFEITQPQQVAERRKEERTKTIDGKPATYTVEVMTFKTVQVTRRIKGEGVKVYTTAGKEVSAKDVPDKLKKPAIVLLAADGNEVDPFYLKIIKPDTLVIVAPTGATAVAPPGAGPKPPAAAATEEAKRAAEEAAEAAAKRDEAAKRAAEEAARAEAARAEAAKRAAAEKKPK